MVDLEKLVHSALLDPKTYGEKEKVDFKETYISRVYLVGPYAYKTKKAVNYGYLDQSTLEKRKFNCEKEVRLNRRLCPDIYLGVVPITKEGDKISMGGQGEIVDYAVKMKRFPEGSMMSERLESGKVQIDHIDQIASQLVNFHAHAETSPEITEIGSLNTITLNAEENFSQTEKFVGDLIEAHKYKFTRNQVRRFIKNNEILFKNRAAEGNIKDCHGDMQARNIFITDKAYITDTIEFNDRFRCGDVAIDVAFLAMDLDFHGRKNLSERLVQQYVLMSRDKDIAKLVPFFKCHYAYVRAKVASFRSEQGDASSKKEAAQYYDLAYNYSKLLAPHLLVMCGPAGTGKSYLAKQVCEELGAELLQSDVIRMELMKLSSVPREDIPGAGIFSPEKAEQVYKEMISRASKKLGQRSIILDATFTRRDLREQAYQIANNSPITVIECTCPENVIRQRIDVRTTDPTAVSHSQLSIYNAQKASFEPVTESVNHIVVDTIKPDLVKQIVASLP